MGMAANGKPLRGEPPGSRGVETAAADVSELQSDRGARASRLHCRK